MISAPQSYRPFPTEVTPSRKMQPAAAQIHNKPVQGPVFRFGSAAQEDTQPAENPLEKTNNQRRTLKERFEDWYRNNFLEWRQNIEASYINLRKNIAKAMIVVAAIFSCFPIPNFMRDIIERRFFFSPHRVSSSHFLSPDLRQKILEVGFRPEGKNTYKLDGWYIKAKEGKPTVVFCHGRDCNISGLEPIMKALSDKGYGVFVYDYPGFGQSEGNPSEQALYEAGVAACKFLAGENLAGLKVPYRQQILMGHSLGGAVAVDIATKFAEDSRAENSDARTFNKENNPELEGQPQALILINTFTDLKSTFAKGKQNFHRYVQRLFNENKIRLQFDSKSKIKQVNMPVLVLHGDKDETIDPAFGRELEDNAPKERPHAFHSLPGAKHQLRDNTCQQVTDSVDDFLTQIRSRESE